MPKSKRRFNRPILRKKVDILYNGYLDKINKRYIEISYPYVDYKLKNISVKNIKLVKASGYVEKLKIKFKKEIEYLKNVSGKDIKLVKASGYVEKLKIKFKKEIEYLKKKFKKEKKSELLIKEKLEELNKKHLDEFNNLRNLFTDIDKEIINFQQSFKTKILSLKEAYEENPVVFKIELEKLDKEYLKAIENLKKKYSMIFKK